jgi:hypothetical protein
VRILYSYNIRLWHQLTLHLIELAKNPVALEKLNLVELYKNFIVSFETKLNQLSFVRILVDLSRQLQGNGMNLPSHLVQEKNVLSF